MDPSDQHNPALTKVPFDMYSEAYPSRKRRRRRHEHLLVVLCRSPRALTTCIVLVFSLAVFFKYLPHPAPMRTPIQKHFSRRPDYEDAFQGFKGRQSCGLGGSLDIRQPIEPLCNSANNLLEAMSSGGRAGFNAPYQPRGCDFHIYDVKQICQILDRYEALVIFGDSLMRHLTGTFAMLLRENIEYGGQRQWIRSSIENDCSCDKQVQLYFCHKTDIMSMMDVYENDPGSFKCSNGHRPAIHFRPTAKYPLDAEELDRFINITFAEEKPSRPYALIFGQGLWNELDPIMTVKWIDQIQARLMELKPYIKDIFSPSIFISPSAAGENKQEGFLMTQGNHAVSRFEKAMRELVPTRGLDFLGTYNMSIQASIPDGTHSGLRINLLKALTIINWLDMFGSSHETLEKAHDKADTALTADASQREVETSDESDVPPFSADQHKDASVHTHLLETGNDWAPEAEGLAGYDEDEEESREAFQAADSNEDDKLQGLQDTDPPPMMDLADVWEQFGHRGHEIERIPINEEIEIIVVEADGFEDLEDDEELGV